MFNNIGVSGLVLILAIALIVFGPSKLPQLGRAFGDTLREFRNSTRNIIEEDEHVDKAIAPKDTTKLL
jgi:sec-independent protein translocase protein TatA